MRFYCKKVFLLDNFTLVVKNKSLYFRISFNNFFVYFKLSNNLYLYVFQKFVYFVGFYFLKASINSFFKSLFFFFLQNVQKFKIFFYVRGYNCQVDVYKNFLIFFLGYIHPIIYKLPKYFKSFLINDNENEFFIEGSNKKKLLSILVDLKKLRSLDVYGGKGVFLVKEVFVARKTKKEIKK